MPTNAKRCESCGHTNDFRRVKCEKCAALLPEGNYERSKRLREQMLKREQQVALSSSLFSDKMLFHDEEELGEMDADVSAMLSETESDTAADDDFGSDDSDVTSSGVQVEDEEEEDL